MHFFFLLEMFIDYNVTSPANPGDYRLVLIWLVKVKPLPAHLKAGIRYQYLKKMLNFLYTKTRDFSCTFRLHFKTGFDSWQIFTILHDFRAKNLSETLKIRNLLFLWFDSK
jgi:hypothetical protein